MGKKQLLRNWLMMGVLAIFALLSIACQGKAVEKQVLSGDIKVEEQVLSGDIKVEEQVLSGETKIEAGEFYFKPTAITVRAGTPVNFVVTNTGGMAHDFVFPELKANLEELNAQGIVDCEACGIQIQGGLLPGATQVILMTFNEPGTYSYICSIPGHAERGMKGTVKVVR